MRFEIFTYLLFTMLNKLTHHTRTYLSKHVSTDRLKLIAFVIALFACLSLGSIMLFSLFATSIHDSMSYSYLEINFIASLLAIGMYLCLPVLGYLADCYGPALLSIILIWLFCPSYFVNSLIISGPSSRLNLYILALNFCLIGLATSSLYFASLLTCAKIYPNHKGLAISLPVSCYGLSTLIGSQIMKLPVFIKPNGYLELSKVFGFFSGLYFIIGILNFVSNSIVSMELQVLFNESTPLLEEDDLIPQRSVVEPINHGQRFKNFVKDKSSWLLLVSLILNLGPLESFQNNLGSIIENTAHPIQTNLSDQIGILATSSTITRLLMGGLSDYLSSDDRKYPINRTWLLSLIILMGSLGQFALVKSGLIDFKYISVLNGASYGGIFTIYPTIVASIWGIDIMGSTWGSLMLAPALGSIIYSISYGKTVDYCESQFCLNGYFNTTSWSLLLSLVLLLVTWRAIWYNRGFKMF